MAEAGGCFSARVGIRTPNLLIRSQMLYPIELRMHFSVLENLEKGCKDTQNFAMFQYMALSSVYLCSKHP